MRDPCELCMERDRCAGGHPCKKKLLTADIKKSARRLRNIRKELCSERKSG